MGINKKNMKRLLSNMRLVKQLGTFDQTAYAYYIDAGTAGLIIQGLVGVLVAGLAMGVVFRRRLSYWVKSKFGRSGNSGDEEDTEDALPAETKSESGE